MFEFPGNLGQLPELTGVLCNQSLTQSDQSCSFYGGKDLCKGEFQLLLYSTCVALHIDGCHAQGTSSLKTCHSCNSGDKINANCQNNIFCSIITHFGFFSLLFMCITGKNVAKTRVVYLIVTL